MKISELIKSIVCEAEVKFGVVDSDGERFHVNDTVSVYIYFVDESEWQVGLERPSQNQLDCGEVNDYTSCRVSENRVGFFTKGPTLLAALNSLYDQVIDAQDWEFSL